MSNIYNDKKSKVRRFNKHFGQENNNKNDKDIKEKNKSSLTPEKKNRGAFSINFFLLDTYDNIKNIKTIDKQQSFNDIILFLNSEGKTIQKVYVIDDLTKVYDFIKIEYKTARLRTIGLLLPKQKNNKSVYNQEFLLNEIKKYNLIKEISNTIKINLEKEIVEIKELSDNDDPEIFKTRFSISKIEPIEPIKKKSSQIFNSSKIINEIKDNKIINVINIDNNGNHMNNYNNKKANNLSNEKNSGNDKSNINLDLNNNKFHKNNNYNSNESNNNNNNNLNNEQLLKKLNDMENQIQYMQKNFQEVLLKLLKEKSIEQEEDSQIIETPRSTINDVNNTKNNNNRNRKRRNRISNADSIDMINLNSENNLNRTIPSPNTEQQNQNSTTISPLTINSNNLFSIKGLKNIGSTYYLNATLQCLLHINDLISYFLNEYPKVCNDLNEKNSYIDSGGNISKAFYELIIGVEPNNDINNQSSSSSRTSTGKKRKFSSSTSLNKIVGDISNNSSNVYSPVNFKKVIGYYNPQFRKINSLEPKDLVLYLLQKFHEELNYCGSNSLLPFIGQPNQFNETETFNHFLNTYNIRNFSIISSLFYGTFKNVTKCKECSKSIFNFQKFELINFGMFKYQKKLFNIYNGFDDYKRPQTLNLFCSNCNKLCDVENTCEIINSPNILIISFDYGANSIYMPSTVEFYETIDLTKYIFDSGEKIKYKIICVCKPLDETEKNRHFIAYCKNKFSDEWYKFNDTFCSQCHESEIYGGSPYLLFYEKMN